MPLSSMKINEKEVPSSLVYNFRTIIMEGVKVYIPHIYLPTVFYYSVFIIWVA